MLDERQLTVCAIALFADGYSPPQIGKALQVDQDRAQKLISAGADAQANGKMGYMKQGCKPSGCDRGNDATG